jgi:prevent-host-death family protein
MEQVGIRALKAALSEFVRRAAAGERILVTERGRPVAELGPHQSGNLPERLAELVSRGQVNLATRPPILPRLRPRLRSRVSLSDALIEERGNERLLR